MMDFLEFIKKLWANKRTRALAILVIYFVFFIFVFMFLGSNKIVPVIDSPLEKLKNSELIKLEFTGLNNFSVEDNKINYNGIYYTTNNIPEELLGYDLLIYKPVNIYNLIDNSIMESENYVTKTITYLISFHDFESIIYNTDNESNQNVRITVAEDISYVLLDLEECYGYKVKMYLRS